MGKVHGGQNVGLNFDYFLTLGPLFWEGPHPKAIPYMSERFQIYSLYLKMPPLTIAVPYNFCKIPEYEIVLYVGEGKLLFWHFLDS
jgi:hypothetical protein